MKTYLKAYNLLLGIGWLILLIYQIVNGFPQDRFSIVLLNICQLAALMEIVHAATGWVKSPVVTTAIQVASRVFVVILIDFFLLPHEYINWNGISGWHLVILAWCITEIVRYFYYFNNLIGKEIAPLQFMRYSTFLPLYPIGVAGEVLIVLSVMKKYGWLNWIALILGAILILYVVFFPRMYGHMLTQRKKKLNYG